MVNLVLRINIAINENRMVKGSRTTISKIDKNEFLTSSTSLLTREMVSPFDFSE